MVPGTTSPRARRIKCDLQLRKMGGWVKKGDSIPLANEGVPPSEVGTKPPLRRIHRWDGCTACNRSIIRRRIDLLDLSTLQAWLSMPISDSRSLWEQAFLLSHSRRISIPRIIKHVDGPSRLWAAIGMLNEEHTLLRIARERSHCDKARGPIITKSSK